MTAHPPSASGDTGTGFTPLGRTEVPVRQVERGAACAPDRRFGGRHGYEVVLPAAFLDQMLALARAAAPNECFGLVVGAPCADARGRHDLVTGVVLDLEARASPGGVQTTPSSEARTRALVRALHPERAILGWFHSHVGCPARFSAADRTNQKTWPEGALGIVVNPEEALSIALYRGPASELLTEIAVTPAASDASSFTPLVPERGAAPGHARRILVMQRRVRPGCRPARSRHRGLLAVVLAGALGLWWTHRLMVQVAALAAEFDGTTRRNAHRLVAPPAPARATVSGDELPVCVAPPIGSAPSTGSTRTQDTSPAPVEIAATPDAHARDRGIDAPLAMPPADRPAPAERVGPPPLDAAVRDTGDDRAPPRS